MDLIERLRTSAKEQRQFADQAGFTKSFVRSTALYNEAADRIEALQAILDEMMTKNPVHMGATTSHIVNWRNRYAALISEK